MMRYVGIFDPQIVLQNLVAAAGSLPLMAIPFCIFAGEIMNRGGMSQRIIDLAMAWTGHRKGDPGFVAIFACVFTPTGVAVIAVFYARTVSLFICPEMKQGDLREITLDAARTTAAVPRSGIPRAVKGPPIRQPNPGHCLYSGPVARIAIGLDMLSAGKI